MRFFRPASEPRARRALENVKLSTRGVIYTKWQQFYEEIYKNFDLDREIALELSAERVLHIIPKRSRNLSRIFCYTLYRTVAIKYI